MEKKIVKFESPAVVTLVDILIDAPSVNRLSSVGTRMNFIPESYSKLYKLFINDIEVDGTFLNPEGEVIINSSTSEIITRDFINSFLEDKQ